MCDFLDDSGICPVCNSNFHNRVRLLSHVSETRKRSKTNRATCRELLLRGAFPKISPDMRVAYEMKDREMRRAAQRAGRSHVLADLPAKRRRLNTGMAAAASQPVFSAPSPLQASCVSASSIAAQASSATRRRLRRKTTVSTAAHVQIGMPASDCIAVQEASSHKRRRTTQ